MSATLIRKVNCTTPRAYASGLETKRVISPEISRSYSNETLEYIREIEAKAKQEGYMYSDEYYSDFKAIYAIILEGWQ